MPEIKCNHQRGRSDCTYLQSDPGLCCLYKLSFDYIPCLPNMARTYLDHMDFQIFPDLKVKYGLKYLH